MLDAMTQRQMWIPPGFAHGFLVLEDNTHFLYKTTDYYARDCERAIAWNDPAIGIDWPKLNIAPLLSAKDAAAPALEQAETV
jgi:dTDP-4-dehydrorhamnose 3,5-epimerase